MLGWCSKCSNVIGWWIWMVGTCYRFDKTSDYKRMNRNNDKCLFFITQWKTVMSKWLTTFFRRWTISFKSGIPCENTRYVRLETDFRSKETRQGVFRHELQDGSILVQDAMFMVNYFLPTPITIFPDGLFICKKPAAKLCGIYHYEVLRNEDTLKIAPETLVPEQFVWNQTSAWCRGSETQGSDRKLSWDDFKHLSNGYSARFPC